MRTGFFIAALLAITCALFAQQPVNPLNPAIFAEQLSDSGQYPRETLDEIVGSRTILWIVCTADSGALPQQWPHQHPDWGNTRVCNPTTYAMPSWAGWVFDSTEVRSLTSYYKDQSSNRFTVKGKVVGRDSLHVFRCDPNPNVRPRHTDQSGGYAFYQNIMQKVDSVVNYADYLDDPNSTVGPYIIFNIYGLAEDCYAESGGQWPLPGTPTTTDTNALGQRITMSSMRGVVVWSNSEQGMALGPCGGATNNVMAAFWVNMNIAAHEFGHNIGMSHTFCDGCPGGEYYNENDTLMHVGPGSFDVMGYEIAFPDPSIDCGTPARSSLDDTQDSWACTTV